MVMMTSILMVLLSVKQSLKNLIPIKPKEFNHEKTSQFMLLFFYGADIGGCTGASTPGSEAVCFQGQQIKQCPQSAMQLYKKLL